MLIQLNHGTTPHWHRHLALAPTIGALRQRIGAEIARAPAVAFRPARGPARRPEVAGPPRAAACGGDIDAGRKRRMGAAARPLTGPGPSHGGIT